MLTGLADTIASSVLSLVLCVNQERFEADSRSSRRQCSAFSSGQSFASWKRRIIRATISPCDCTLGPLNYLLDYCEIVESLMNPARYRLRTSFRVCNASRNREPRTLVETEVQ